MDTAPRSRRTFPLAVAGAFLCGVGLATQSRINGQLGAELQDGYLAALISFGTGLVILFIGMLLIKKGRDGVRRIRDAIASGQMPWWYTIGGAAGAFFVLSQGIASAPLGVALFSIGIVCGQTVSGVVIDRIGLGTHEPRPVSAQRILGAVLALVAVGIAASSQFGSGSASFLFIMPFVAGLLTAWQQATNGQVRNAAGSVLTATFGNFLVGTIVLLVATIVHSLIVGSLPEVFPGNPVLYLGGAIGIVFIALGSVVVGITGVLLLTLGTISGQLLGSLVLDVVVPVAGHGIQWTTLVGVAVALIAVVIVATAKSGTSTR